MNKYTGVYNLFLINLNKKSVSASKTSSIIAPASMRSIRFICVLVIRIGPFADEYNKIVISVSELVSHLPSFLRLTGLRPMEDSIRLILGMYFSAEYCSLLQKCTAQFFRKRPNRRILYMAFSVFNSNTVPYRLIGSRNAGIEILYSILFSFANCLILRKSSIRFNTKRNVMYV